MKKIEKNKLYMILGIIVLILSIAGSAYAYYSASATASIKGTAGGGGGLTLKIEKLSTSATKDLIPLDNSTDMLTKALLGYGNTSNKFDSSKACIDKNGYTVCQVYKIIVSNTSSVPITINGGVSLKGDNTPNIACTTLDNTNSVTSNKSCKGSKTLASKYNLSNGNSKEYYILVYIKNINDTQTDSGNFTGTVTFTSSDGSELKARFEDEPALTTLTNLGLEVDTEHTPDFTTVSGNSGIKKDDSGNTLATGLGDNTKGIYKATDDLGTSYYFRGNVDNNYVYFAKNWWRIIRINGDGTIRMIYTGNPNSSSSQEYISESAFNENHKDNTYVGYMYGTAGSSTYVDTHKNTNNSAIKTVIDSWYQDNLSSYSQYIADAIYCNDREVINNFNLVVGEQTMSFTGNGSGTTQTAYASLKRNFVDHNPTLKCTNKNDRFTTKSSLGNGALTYPIGLVTTDEVVMAGGYAIDMSNGSYIKNDSYYLYIGDNYWTMTSTAFLVDLGGCAAVDAIAYTSLVSYNVVDDSYYPVRPVVTLVSNAISSGDGTSSNPFYVGSAPKPLE